MNVWFSVLPESPRWFISKGRFADAEKILRRIAVDNKRNFDQDAFEKLKQEQEKVRSIFFSSSINFFIRLEHGK